MEEIEGTITDSNVCDKTIDLPPMEEPLGMPVVSKRHEENRDRTYETHKDAAQSYEVDLYEVTTF